jgi:integrase
MLGALAADGRWGLLADLGKGLIETADLFEPWRSNTLDAWLLTRSQATRDVDLQPLLDAWYRALASERPETAAKYRTQLRTLIPDGTPFRVTQFTKSALRVWLDDKPARSRNRYRAAASSFAAFLVERDVLEVNVARLVRAAKVVPPRMRYLDSAQAQALCAALPEGPHRALHALLLATGADLAGALRVRPEDTLLLRDNQIRLSGTKTYNRDRVRRLLAPWAVPYVQEFFATPRTFGLTADDSPDAIAKATGRIKTVLDRALATCGITDYSTKDHRHTFAVQALRDGYSYAVVAWQLGHANTALAHRTYGNHVVHDADYVRRVAAN